MITPETAAEGEALNPRAAWRNALRDATFDVFSTMVGTTVTVPNAKDDLVVVAEPADSSVLAYVTGMIGIAGAVRAIFSLRCSEKTATAIAAQMLGITKEEASTQKSDAIGEMCNMVAGHFKHQIGLGDSCTLTIPTVVVGGNYSIHCLLADDRIEFPVVYEGETVLVTLDIRK
jgi:CheY-specific phosphatase CheX